MDRDCVTPAAAVDGENGAGIRDVCEGRVLFVTIRCGPDDQAFVALAQQDFGGFKAIEGDAASVVAPDRVLVGALIDLHFATHAEAAQGEARIGENQFSGCGLAVAEQAGVRIEVVGVEDGQRINVFPFIGSQQLAFSWLVALAWQQNGCGEAAVDLGTATLDNQGSLNLVKVLIAGGEFLEATLLWGKGDIWVGANVNCVPAFVIRWVEFDGVAERVDGASFLESGGGIGSDVEFDCGSRLLAEANSIGIIAAAGCGYGCEAIAFLNDHLGYIVVVDSDIEIEGCVDSGILAIAQRGGE